MAISTHAISTHHTIPIQMWPRVGNSSTELMPEWLLLDLEVPDTAGGLAAWYTAMMALLRPTLEGAGAVAATRAPARRVCLGAVHTVCALGARA